MTIDPVVVDTNVVVSGLLTSDREAPTARVLNGMLSRDFNFLLSIELLSEYRAVLLRPKIGRRHGLTEEEVEIILTEIAQYAIIREPEAALEQAPDLNDQHLWALLASQKGSRLVTGDQTLLEPRSNAVFVTSRFRRFIGPALAATRGNGTARRLELLHRHELLQLFKPVHDQMELRSLGVASPRGVGIYKGIAGLIGVCALFNGFRVSPNFAKPSSGLAVK